MGEQVGYSFASVPYGLTPGRAPMPLPSLPPLPPPPGVLVSPTDFAAAWSKK